MPPAPSAAGARQQPGSVLAPRPELNLLPAAHPPPQAAPPLVRTQRRRRQQQQQQQQHVEEHKQAEDERPHVAAAARDDSVDGSSAQGELALPPQLPPPVGGAITAQIWPDYGTPGGWHVSSDALQWAAEGAVPGPGSAHQPAASGPAATSASERAAWQVEHLVACMCTPPGPGWLRDLQAGRWPWPTGGGLLLGGAAVRSSSNDVAAAALEALQSGPLAAGAPRKQLRAGQSARSLTGRRRTTSTTVPRAAPAAPPAADAAPLTASGEAPTQQQPAVPVQAANAVSAMSTRERSSLSTLMAQLSAGIAAPSAEPSQEPSTPSQEHHQQQQQQRRRQAGADDSVVLPTLTRLPRVQALLLEARTLAASLRQSLATTSQRTAAAATTASGGEAAGSRISAPPPPSAAAPSSSSMDELQQQEARLALEEARQRREAWVALNGALLSLVRHAERGVRVSQRLGAVVRAAEVHSAPPAALGRERRRGGKGEAWRWGEEEELQREQAAAGEAPSGGGDAGGGAPQVEAAEAAWRVATQAALEFGEWMAPETAAAALLVRAAPRAWPQPPLANARTEASPCQLQRLTLIPR